MMNFDEAVNNMVGSLAAALVIAVFSLLRKSKLWARVRRSATTTAKELRSVMLLRAIRQARLTYLLWLTLLFLLLEVFVSGAVFFLGFRVLLAGPSVSDQGYLITSENNEAIAVTRQDFLDAAVMKPEFNHTLILAGDILLMIPTFVLGGFAAKSGRAGGYPVLLLAVLIVKGFVNYINILGDPTFRWEIFLPVSMILAVVSASVGFWWLQGLKNVNSMNLDSR